MAEPEIFFEGSIYKKPQTGEEVKVGAIKQRNPNGREFIILSHAERKWKLIFKHLPRIKEFFE